MPSVLTNKKFPPDYCKSFPRKVAVAVEGIDFFHLLRSQYNRERTDDICLYDFCSRAIVGGLEPKQQIERGAEPLPQISVPYTD